MEGSSEERYITLPDLPEDVFILILDALDGWDVVRCRMVSTAWQRAFQHPSYLRLALKKYPNAREAQYLSTVHADIDWRAVFDPVACRYYHLSVGMARTAFRQKLRPLEQYGQWYPVGQWDYHESQPGGRLYYENAATHLSRLGNKPYLFRATLWSYDDGLVALAPSAEYESASYPGQVLSILDCATYRQYAVPFNCVTRTIRNIMFRNRALVIEWAEKDPYHDLNDNEKVHRHFATCYDVQSCCTEGVTDFDRKWQITFRNEWKMHFLGLPLNSRDRFFSTHNGKHYAVYFWQPNRSMYTGDEDMPIEALSIWDITTASTYLPSTDPTRSAIPSEDKRPYMVARYSFRELDFIGVRQHSNISLLSLSLDSQSCTLTVRENTCVAGQGYFDPAERLMMSTTTTFPFLGHGPAYRKDWDRDLPPYRGHCSMESTEIENVERWFFPIMDVLDPVSGVRFSLVETCFTGQMENRLVIRIKSLGKWVTLDDGLVKMVAGMGKIAGDERWLVGQNEKMELVILQF